MTNFSCNHTTNGISINPIWHGLCQSASSLCCTNHLETEYCVSGRGAARGKMNCDEVQFVTTESSIFRDCCKSCNIGLAVAAENGSCSDNQILSSLSRNAADSFSICCNGNEGDFFIGEGWWFFLFLFVFLNFINALNFQTTIYVSWLNWRIRNSVNKSVSPQWTVTFASARKATS